MGHTWCAVATGQRNERRIRGPLLPIPAAGVAVDLPESAARGGRVPLPETPRPPDPRPPAPSPEAPAPSPVAQPSTSLYLAEFRGPEAGERGSLGLPVRVDERGVVVRARRPLVAWMEGLPLAEVRRRLARSPGQTTTWADLVSSISEGDRPVHTPGEVEEPVRDRHATPVAAYENREGVARAAVVGATRTHRQVTVVLELVRDAATDREGVRPVAFQPPTPWERGDYGLPQAAGPGSAPPNGDRPAHTADTAGPCPPSVCPEAARPGRPLQPAVGLGAREQLWCAGGGMVDAEPLVRPPRRLVRAASDGFGLDLPVSGGGGRAVERARVVAS